MATIKQLYGTQNQAFTITLAALANATGSYGAGRTSVYIDNTTNLFFDALVQVQVLTSASALANDKSVYVYAYGSAFGTSNFTDGVGGTDAAFTAPNPPNMRMLGVLNCPASSTTYTGGPWSASSAFGGNLPEYWGIYVVNFTGQALGATASAWYQGVQAQSV